RTQLISTLDGARRHILGGLDGLTDEQLRQPMLPSGWSCLGLDWELTPSETADGILGAYRDEIVRANARLHTLSPDDPPRWRDPRWTEWGMDFPDVRTIVLHMIIETATHAGHLDASRELIDGRQWIKL